MERNIVLSYELEKLNIFLALGLIALLRQPPALPVKACLACFLKLICQLGSDGDISDRGIEPYIEHFVLVASLWHRDTPFQIPGDGPLVESCLEPGLGGVDCVVRPLAILADLVHPLFQLDADGRKVDI